MSITHLFGRSGEIYPKILNDIVRDATGTTYNFMDIEQFKVLTLGQRNKVYWEEILYRTHWAAVANSIRHLRWFDACVIHATSQPNYLAFCATLRGLLESAADINYSLQAVPLSIATSAGSIIKALNGELVKSEIISTELEANLIHFLHARDTRGEKLVPPTHKAKTATKYLKSIDSVEFPVNKMYSELCQVVHPGAPSLHWLTQLGENGWKVGKQDDIGNIHNLMNRYKNTISWIQQISGNITILICQVLNSFPRKQLHVESVRSCDMSELALHKKIRKEFARQDMLWP